MFALAYVNKSICFDWVCLPGGGMGRGRTGAFFFTLLGGFITSSFIADAEGDGATVRLG